MKRYSTILATALGLALGFQAAAIAQNTLPTIDDFKTGIYKRTISSGTDLKTETGTGMMGGARSTYLQLNNSTYFGQSATIQVRKGTSQTNPSAVIFSAGFQAYPRLDMGYGNLPNPLHADFTPYDRFRVHFVGINGTLNFNILAFTSTSWLQFGCNLAPTFVPTTVDLPFANGVGPGVTWSSIDTMDFIFQSSGEGGQDFAISLIELVPAGTAPGDVTCGPIGK